MLRLARKGSSKRKKEMLLKKNGHIVILCEGTCCTIFTVPCTCMYLSMTKDVLKNINCSK